MKHRQLKEVDIFSITDPFLCIADEAWNIISAKFMKQLIGNLICAT